MPRPTEYRFSRYLAAKKSVDDRSLNRHAWDTLAAHLRNRPTGETLKVLEIGAGIGTMIERLVEWGAIGGETHLTAIEPEMTNVEAALERLGRFAEAHDIRREPAGKLGIKLALTGGPLLVDFQTVDLETFAGSHGGPGRFEVIIAHAVLDLLDIPSALEQVLSLAAGGCLFYFTINFDGATILEPAIDPPLDRQIEELYHRTMDQRVTHGKPSGDRYTGRHLFGTLRARGLNILAAGSSDWVVWAGPDGYNQDEAYFLHFIVNTIGGALDQHPELDQARFADWIEQRHRQIERGELVYIAHQIDILARR